MTATAIKRNDRVVVRRLARAVAMSTSGEGRQLREQCGLALGPLASVVQTSVATLSRWERGLSRPSGPAAVRWAQILEDLERCVARGRGAA